MCDEKGEVIDGDQLMALIAADWHETGVLKGGAVVATVMSNLGLERYLNDLGIALKRMPVGDRYVVDHMRGNGYNLGGEQSGHIILGDYGTTGDGTLAALQVLSIMRRKKLPASKIGGVFTPVPQILKNIRFQHSIDLDTPEVAGYLAHQESLLKGAGRILVRKSGTEALIRVMAEGDDNALVTRMTEEIAAWLLERDMPTSSEKKGKSAKSTGANS